MLLRTEDALRALLESRGYSVKSPARLEGKSGILHDFSLCAKKGEEKKIAVAVEGSGRPVLISILSLYAKALDTHLDRPLLVTDAPITEEARRLAELYNVHILPSGISASDLEQQLEDLFSSDHPVLFPSTASPN